MDLFNLFAQYHETTFNEFKKELINSIKLDILNINQRNKHMCGHKRTQNRGYCRRLCEGDACKYHLKYIEINNDLILKSDISDTSDDVIIYKDICKNIITKDILFNIKIKDSSKSNIILKYNLNDDINNYIFNLKSKINIFKSLTSFIILYNKIKRKREKKRLKNIKKKERKKAKIYQTSVSDLESNNKINGVLLKEKDNYYTIDFYDEKVAADCVEGILCNYCSSIRYTQSGPCINANCHNRTFDNIEFVIYYKKHKKHKKSIHNPFLNN